MRERYGVQESQHVLIDSLREAGFEHEDIDVVVLSAHLHFDHAGGLLAAWSEGRARAAVPNATYVVGAALAAPRSHTRAIGPVSFLELPGLLQASGRLEVVEGSTEGTWPQRALQLQRRAYAGADAGRDRWSSACR